MVGDRQWACIVMIKIFLKHFIYEKCIDVIFNQIVLNFSDVKSEEFRIRMMKVHLGDMTFNIRRPIGTIYKRIPKSLSPYAAFHKIQKEITQISN